MKFSLSTRQFWLTVACAVAATTTLTLAQAPVAAPTGGVPSATVPAPTSGVPSASVPAAGNETEVEEPPTAAAGNETEVEAPTATAGNGTGTGGEEYLAAIIAADEELATLTAALEAADITGDFAEDGEFTFFAPVNDALADIDPKLLTENWRIHLQAILGYHVARGVVLSTELSDGMELGTLLGGAPPLNVSISDGGVAIIATNSEANVIEADILAINGVLHKIDALLVPPFMSETLFALSTSDLAPPEVKDLLKISGLESVLDTEDVTIFAPESQAFAALSETVDVAALTSDPDAVATILSYHIVRGVHPRYLLVDGYEMTTWSNLTLTVETTGEGRFAERTIVGATNSANVTFADGLASNGLAFFISAVLLPEGFGGEPVAPTPPTATPPTADGGSPTATPPSSGPAEPTAPTASPPSGAHMMSSASFVVVVAGGVVGMMI